MKFTRKEKGHLVWYNRHSSGINCSLLSWASIFKFVSPQLLQKVILIKKYQKIRWSWLTKLFKAISRHPRFRGNHLTQRSLIFRESAVFLSSKPKHPLECYFIEKVDITEKFIYNFYIICFTKAHGKSFSNHKFLRIIL